MNLGQFRAQTRHLPDATPVLVGFEDFTADAFVDDVHFAGTTADWDALRERYGFHAFGPPPPPALVLFTFVPPDWDAYADRFAPRRAA